MKGLLDGATVKPQIVDNGLSLQVVDLTALGSKLSTDTVQKTLDDLTSKATKNYPLGIHADSVVVAAAVRSRLLQRRLKPVEHRTVPDSPSRVARRSSRRRRRHL